MSHHTNSRSGDRRHDHSAERHHHRHSHHQHGSESEGRRRLGPHVAARATGSPQEIAGYLDELAGAIRAGGVTIRTGARAVGLRLNGEVAFDLRAAAGDGGTSRLDLSLSWHAPQLPPPPAPPAPRLRISTLHAPEAGEGWGSAGESGQPQPPSENGSPSLEGQY